MIIRSSAGKGCQFTSLTYALSLLLIPALAPGAETVLMEVTLNSQQEGDFAFYLDKADTVFFPRRTLVDMGLVYLPKVKSQIIAGKEYVNLRDFAPALSYSIDMKAVTLSITASPEMFAHQIKTFGHKPPPGLQMLAGPSAYVNYSLGYSQYNGQEFFTFPWEVAARSGKGTLYSGFKIDRDNERNHYMRLNSNYTVDDMNHLRRIVFGDFAASSGDLGGGGLFAGLSISKYYGLDPYLALNSGLNINGIATTPSDVRVYLNGRLIQRDTVAPGPFELVGISNFGGLQNYTLVIRDAYGRETTIDNTVYLAPSLLKVGIDEYSFNFGLRRENAGQANDQYHDPTLIAYYRKGVTSNYTGGVRLEANKNLQNSGMENEFTLRHSGDIKVSLAASREGRDIGDAGNISYRFQRNTFSMLLLLEHGSRNYATLSVPAGKNTIKSVTQLFLGLNIFDFGNISISTTKSRHYIIADSQSYSLRYSMRLSKGLSLNVLGSRTTTNDMHVGGRAQYSISANLMMLLGGSAAGGLNISRSDSDHSEGAFLFQNSPYGEGIGYELNLDTTRRNDTGYRQSSGNGILDYNGPYGKYELGYQHSGQSDQYTVQAAGAVGFVDGSYYLSRPIFDGFAVVKVNDIEGVRVMEDNQVVGRTNKDGEVMVPRLISYSENHLAIDDHDIPVNYEIAELDKEISIPFRSGGLVEFPATKLQGITGHLNIQEGEKQKAKPAEYWGLDVRVAGKINEVVVGKGGEFYLENIPSGTYKARVFENDKFCNFDLVIPKSKDMMIDLGKITCVAH